jgi:hypothetical protein
VSNPPLKTIYGTSEPKQDGKLTQLVVPTCTHVRKQLKRVRSNDPLAPQPLAEAVQVRLSRLLRSSR